MQYVWAKGRNLCNEGCSRKVAIVQPELREHAPHTTSVLKTCDFPAGAAGARSTYYVCTYKLRFSSRSCGSTLRILRLYLKVAIFQPELQEHAPCTTFVLKSCDFQAGAAADQGGIEPRPRDCESRHANHKTTSKGRFASKKIARRHRFARDHSESDPTRTISAEGSSGSRQMRTGPQRQRTISAEGSPRSRQIRTGPQRQRFDTHDLRRGFAADKTNSHGTTATALRHARSPQRVRRGQDKFARRHSDSASTRTISAEGSPWSRQIRTEPQRERFDTHDLRRGFIGLKTDSHGTTARAIRHARSPQRGAFRKLPAGLPPPEKEE